MVLIFSGYKDLGQGYYAKRELITAVSGLILKEIIYLGRFKSPTEEGVVNYIHRKSYQVETNESIKNPKKLEEMLSAMPKELLQAIRDNNPEIRQYLRMHNPAPKVDTGNAPIYIFARGGLVPLETYLLLEIQSENKNPDIRKVMENPELKSRRMGNSFEVRILLENGTLIPTERMKMLLDNEVKLSKAIRIEGNISTAEGNKLVGRMYKALKDPHRIRELTDNYRLVMEDYAIIAIKALYDNFKIEMKELRDPAKVIESSLDKYMVGIADRKKAEETIQ